jgi:uncharacterized protein
MELLFLPLHRNWENYYAAFDAEDLKIYRISADTKRQIELLYNNNEVPKEAISRFLGTALNDSEDYTETQCKGKQLNIGQDVHDNADSDVIVGIEGSAGLDCDRSFDTLILHISNCCNMKCGYCFAGHGSYRSESGLMTKQTAKQTLDVFFNRYPYIREIKLFGGEPFLNPDVMEFVGKYVQDYKGHHPEIKVITNGTILSECIKRIIKDYGIKVVFSIDGDEIVHNRGRFFADGTGSFATVYRNFMELREYTQNRQPYSIDVTYSGIHEKSGITVNDVVWFLTDTFGVKPSKVNVSLITVPEDSPYALSCTDKMIESSKQSLQKAYEGDIRTHMKLKAVIRRLKKRECTGPSICSACKSWIAVSHTGKVYPCLMFMDRKEYEMGDITTELFETPQYLQVYNQFQSYHKQEHFPCSKCFARKICAVCAGINEFYTGSLYHSNENQCHEMQEIVKVVIQGVAEGVW